MKDVPEIACRLERPQFEFFIECLQDADQDGQYEGFFLLNHDKPFLFSALRQPRHQKVLPASPVMLAAIPVQQKLYESFASGDIAAVMAALADDIAWTEADGLPLAGTYIGPQAVVEDVFMRLGEFSDNWGVVVHRLAADGDTVVADGKYTWNNKKSGAPCEVRMAHVWTPADGKAISFLQHVDTAKVRDLIA